MTDLRIRKLMKHLRQVTFIRVQYAFFCVHVPKFVETRPFLRSAKYRFFPVTVIYPAISMSIIIPCPFPLLFSFWGRARVFRATRLFVGNSGGLRRAA